MNQLASLSSLATPLFIMNHTSYAQNYLAVTSPLLLNLSLESLSASSNERKREKKTSKSRTHQAVE